MYSTLVLELVDVVVQDLVGFEAGRLNWSW
jgi:hypothetical protein